MDMELTYVTLKMCSKRYNRPRKVLGFRSPHEALFWVEMSYTKSIFAVAFLT